MPYYTVALSKSKVGPRRGAAPLASPVPQQTTGALQRLAGSVVEAGCLVAVLALPLYFTVLTSGYEPDKAVLLRALACITAVAWLAGLPGGRPARTRPGPLFWLSALLFLAYCLATVLSIQPTTSLWGLHNRQEGLWTRASYLIFLVAVVTRFRDRAQLDRLISVLLIGSVPVVLYGFIQEFRLDPVPTSGSPETLQWPVWSSFGQHVFFGSYLVFIIPFTLARVLSGWEGRSPVSSAWYGAREVAVGAGTLALMAAGYFAFLRLGVDHPALFAALAGLLAGYVLAALYLLGLPETPALRRARSVGYLGFLALQVLTLIFTGTRASWLGALAALPVFGFLVARRTHRARIARTILGATAAAGLFLLLLNIPNGPLKPLRTIHGLNRLANITDSGGSEGSAQGRLLIWQGVKDLVTTDPAVGGTWGGIGRSLIGYGPETMRVAFQRVFPLTLRRVNSEINVWDRAHDIYLDYLVDAGLVALLLLLAILAVFFWRVLRLLPAVPDRSAWLLIAAASAMVGHLVDGLFSIETVVSFLLFWLVIALVAGDGLRADGAPEAAPAFGRPAAVFAVALAALMAALLAVSTADSPALLGILWLLAVVMGIAAVARSLAGATLPATGLPGVSLPIGGVVPALRRRVPSRRQTSPHSPATRYKRVAAAGALGLLAILGLGSQYRFQTAAVADRTGTNYLQAGQSAKALGYLQQAVSSDGYDSQVQTDLAEAYFSLGAARGDSAEPSYAPAPGDERSIDPSRAVNLGQSQLFGLAQYALQSARALSPLDPDTAENLGILYLQWNQPSQALAQFVHAEELSPNNPKYLDDEAQTYLAMKRTGQAEAAARAALALDNTYWLSHYTLALVEHARGTRAAAKQEATQALIWVVNFWPPPPSQELAQLRSLQKTG